MKFKNVLNESSLTRLWKKYKDYDSPTSLRLTWLNWVIP